MLNEAWEFEKGQATTSLIIFDSWLKHIPRDINAFEYREPGDWNRRRKLNCLGAKLVRHSEPLLLYYKERNRTLG